MRILIAEDDTTSRHLLEARLRKWDYDVVATCDGLQAWEELQREEAPRLAILDWMMPGLDGLEVCRRLRAMEAEGRSVRVRGSGVLPSERSGALESGELVRQNARTPELLNALLSSGGEVAPVYVILLTAKGSKDSVVLGLAAGADDYLVKPFDLGELRARIRVGIRTVELQHALANRVRELEEAFARIDLLEGILPICCYCKSIRDDQDYWQQADAYFSTHTPVRFSHCICPDCYQKVVEPELRELQRQQG